MSHSHARHSFLKSAVMASATVLALSLGVSGASAGDFGDQDGEPLAYDWSGLYFGVQAGLGTGQAEGTADIGIPITVNPAVSGALYGGHVGYNHQMGQTVVGIEATASAASISGGESCVIVFGCTFESDWIGTVAGRLGYTMDRTMVYGLAGVAWGDVQTTVDIIGFPILEGGATHVGWVGGFGIEHAISDSVRARVEYNHIDLGSETHNLAIGGVPVLPAEVDLNLDTIKVGVSFNLN